MVKIHVKKGDESQFLLETTVNIGVGELLTGIERIYNRRLKVNRVCGEIEQLAKAGVALPPNMQGLTEEQITELKLIDEWGNKCEPSGGFEMKPDDIGRRNGKVPLSSMAQVLTKTVKEAKDLISNKNVEQNICVGDKEVTDALDMLRGACMIVYPMGLPPHDPIHNEFDDKEDLSGTQDSLEVIPVGEGALWWAGKELTRDKKLSDFIGKNEKSKIIAKIQRKSSGAPAREPVISEEQKKQMMAEAYRRQEELKRMEAESSDVHLDSSWADPNELKRKFQGLNNISWGPR